VNPERSTVRKKKERDLQEPEYSEESEEGRLQNRQAAEERQ